LRDDITMIAPAEQILRAPAFIASNEAEAAHHRDKR
jgi:hypothetical protein